MTGRVQVLLKPPRSMEPRQCTKGSVFGLYCSGKSFQNMVIPYKVTGTITLVNPHTLIRPESKQNGSILSIALVPNLVR